LVRTEVEILEAARRGLLKPHRIGIADKLRTRFIQAIFRSDRKVKVPSTATRVLPGSNLELPAIVRRWDDSRRELHDLLESGTEAELNKGIFRHPVGGWMGMSEILKFFSVHIIHHKHQLARLRIAVGS
jgi:2-hydroxychromene-2-carboxylate isomerase